MEPISMRRVNQKVATTQSPKMSQKVSMNLSQNLFLISKIFFMSAGFLGFSGYFSGPRAFATVESASLEKSNAQVLFHLLDYIGADYPGAVSKGKIIEPSEYQEQVEFSVQCKKLAQDVSTLRDESQFTAQLIALANLVQEKADPAQVLALTQKMKSFVSEKAHLNIIPKSWPTLDQGKVLYAQHCVSCHGTLGNGKGPLASQLEPKPRNFLDLKTSPDLNPLRAFNAVRLGIPGTSMVAVPVSDEEAWSLAFFVTALQHQSSQVTIPGTSLVLSPQIGAAARQELLSVIAQKSDREIISEFGPKIARLMGTEQSDIKTLLPVLRMVSGGPPDQTPQSPSGGSNLGHDEIKGDPSSLVKAVSFLEQAKAAVANARFKDAKRFALLSYLEGVEPIEPKLKSNFPELLVEIETVMGKLRSQITELEEGRAFDQEMQSSLSKQFLICEETLKIIKTKLEAQTASFWMTFLMTVGILLREGLEAILILITLLAVIRASGVKRAQNWVHGGWLSALFVGLLAWIFSGYLLRMSGARREVLEGVISLFAVVVLLILGFWLHSRTEINRWREFIEGQVQAALQGNKLIGVAMISFMAVFREAFETVLFLRAIDLESNGQFEMAIGLGVGCSLVALIIFSSILLRVSAALPIRKIFSISAAVMALLAFILTGKGFHSLQEAGTIEMTPLGSFALRMDWLGLFPTHQTFWPQILVLLLIGGYWVMSGDRSAPKKLSTKTN